MARIARRELVDPQQVEIFHCMNRCVRHAQLCGRDKATGRNYDHRKQWLEERFRLLSQIFAIDLLAYAILSNHFHVILRSRPDIVCGWSDAEVARRWLLLQGNDLSEERQRAELVILQNDTARMTEIRRRLSDISWWMRLTAEPIARRANREDEVTGRFWQGRFKCVKLCDEAALLACMAYVDLNPIRAGVASTPETSEYTSIYRRLESRYSSTTTDAHLVPIAINEKHSGPAPSTSLQRASDKGCLPLTDLEYFDLVDWTGRELKPGKSGAITPGLAPILERLAFPAEHWMGVVQHFGKLFRRVAGAPKSLATAGRFRRGRAELLTRR